MAVELCSESPSRIMSPRISFSHDLSQLDIIPVEQHLLRSNSSSGNDFDFCIRENYDQEPSSAEELFSGGKILPSQIKKKNVPPPEVQPPPAPSPPSIQSHDFYSVSCEISNSEIDNLKETKARVSVSDERQNSKSFWRFKRSSSLNCGSGYGRSLCPLPLLSRSNSTGSAASVKRNSSSTLTKDPNNHSHKLNSQKSSSSSGSKSSQAAASSGNFQKPPLKKGYGSYGNGVRVNPVLNVPSGNLFGFGSIFSTGNKNKKK